MRKFYEKILNICKESNALFYTYYDEKYSYNEFYHNILKINSILHEYKHKRIALYSSKSFYSYCGIFSILLSENIWIPFNPIFPIERNLDMMNITEPSIVLTDCKLSDRIYEYAQNKKIPIYLYIFFITFT